MNILEQRLQKILKLVRTQTSFSRVARRGILITDESKDIFEIKICLCAVKALSSKIVIQL